MTVLQEPVQVPTPGRLRPQSPARPGLGRSGAGPPSLSPFGPSGGGPAGPPAPPPSRQASPSSLPSPSRPGSPRSPRALRAVPGSPRLLGPFGPRERSPRRGDPPGDLLILPSPFLPFAAVWCLNARSVLGSLRVLPVKDVPSGWWGTWGRK